MDLECGPERRFEPKKSKDPCLRSIIHGCASRKCELRQRHACVCSAGVEATGEEDKEESDGLGCASSARPRPCTCVCCRRRGHTGDNKDMCT